MIRVKAKAFIYLLFILILLPSCSGEKDDFVTIEYWTHEDDSRKVLEERLIESFEKENPGVSVIRTEYGSAELVDMISASFGADDGPDLFNLPSEEISALLLNDKLDPVDAASLGYDSIESLKDAYIQSSFSTVTKDGLIYGIPLEYTIWCLYVNRTLLSNHGFNPDNPPATWEELMEIAEKLTIRKDGILECRGFDFRYPYYLSFFVPMVRQLGGDIFAPDGSVIYNDDAWERALSFMYEWGPSGRNLGSPTYANARELFNSEGIAMCLSGLYQESRLLSQNPEFYASGDWMVAPFPVFSDSVSDEAASPYFHYFMVNSASDEKTKVEAWKLAGYFAAHAEEYLDEIGLVMPLKRIADSDLLHSKPYSDVFINDEKRSHEVYSGPHASELQSLIGEAVESVMLYSVPPEKAVQALRASAEELLK